MATLIEINSGLAELQAELETFKNYASQISDAKETAILSSNLSKKILEDYSTIVNSVHNLTENLNVIDLPGRFKEQNSIISGTIEDLHKNQEKIGKLNEQYVSIFNSNKSISNRIEDIHRGINTVNENTSKVDKNIESIPLKLEKLDIVISSINQSFNNLISKFNDLGKNLKDDYHTKSQALEKSIKDDIATKRQSAELILRDMNRQTEKKIKLNFYLILVIAMMMIIILISNIK